MIFNKISLKLCTVTVCLIATLHAEMDRHYHLSVSNYTATARELVYTDTKKLSDLIWQVSNVKLLGIGASGKLKNGILFEASLKKNISDTRGVMDDYDWLMNTPDWSHWSHHENTIVTDVTLLDIHFKEKINKDYFFSLGYSYERTKWIASDGFYIYSSDPGFRDLSGNFNGIGITYIQEFHALYASLGYTKSFDNSEFIFALQRSISGSADDYDTHHQRTPPLQFDSSFNSITFYGLYSSLDYVIRDDSVLKISYQYKEYEEARGITKQTNLGTGAITTYGGAGIANKYSLLTLSLIIEF